MIYHTAVEEKKGLVIAENKRSDIVDTGLLLYTIYPIFMMAIGTICCTVIILLYKDWKKEEIREELQNEHRQTNADE